MAKIKIVYNPLSKEEQDKFDKSQQEFYENHIKHRKENNMTQKDKDELFDELRGAIC